MCLALAVVYYRSVTEHNVATVMIWRIVSMTFWEFMLNGRREWRAKFGRYAAGMVVRVGTAEMTPGSGARQTTLGVARLFLRVRDCPV